MPGVFHPDGGLLLFTKLQTLVFWGTWPRVDVKCFCFAVQGKVVVFWVRKDFPFTFHRPSFPLSLITSHLHFFYFIFLLVALFLTHWPPELYAKNALFGHFGGFEAKSRPSIFNVVEIAFATQPPALLAAFYSILASACAGFRFLDFFPLPFFSFSFLFAAVIDLLLGFLAVKKFLREHHRGGQFLPWSSQKFCSEFFTHLFEHFCAYLRLHWADHSDLGIIGKIFCSCQFWSKVMMSEVEERPSVVTGGSGVNGLSKEIYVDRTIWCKLYFCLDGTCNSMVK